MYCFLQNIRIESQTIDLDAVYLFDIVRNPSRPYLYEIFVFVSTIVIWSGSRCWMRVIMN